MEEANIGVCDEHQSGCDRIKRIGYYWCTIVLDCIDYAKRCDAYQFCTIFIPQPREPLHPTIGPWPFEALGLDVVWPLIPISSSGHLYILVATHYFLSG